MEENHTPANQYGGSMYKDTTCITRLEERHSKAVMGIFNYYIEHSFAAYYEKKFPEAFFSKLMEIISDYPALVCKVNNRCVGFAFLHAFHPAPTMKDAAEITYFIHPDYTGKGLGKDLLDRLIAKAKQQGIRTIIASISSLNVGSLSFHKKNGFIEKGRLENIGTKKGRNFDVVYMQYQCSIAEP